MTFDSLVFLAFFTVFYLLYWFPFNNNLKLQNLFLLFASYLFYSLGDWQCLFYLIGLSAANYYLGIYISRSQKVTVRKALFITGLVIDIGGLAFFKYFNFFVTSSDSLLHAIGLNPDLHTLNILIPVGISFYTFRVISYLIDLQQERIAVCKDLVIFFAYVSFFPSLLSGPIDRAKNFIPQLERPRAFDYNRFVNALRQILWGFFKKAVFANHLAIVTKDIFGNYQHYTASALLFGALCYAIQLYADFSGYTDIAIGVAQLLGFDIARNFNYPFFAQNIAEYWRKWHMSLTSWLTDYLFTPLNIAFRDYGKWGIILAVIINFTIVGLWHGANWTYVLFGFLHGCYFIPIILKGRLYKRKKIEKKRLIPSVRELANMTGTFLLVALTLVIFRAETISAAFSYLRGLVSISIFAAPNYAVWPTAGFLSLFLLIEWTGKDNEYPIQSLGLKWPTWCRWSLYMVMVTLIYYYSVSGPTEQFIYVQF
jgi:alginate O-acetyltransferase complex protein AlgI